MNKFVGWDCCVSMAFFHITGRGKTMGRNFAEKDGKRRVELSGGVSGRVKGSNKIGEAIDNRGEVCGDGVSRGILEIMGGREELTGNVSAKAREVVAEEGAR